MDRRTGFSLTTGQPVSLLFDQSALFEGLLTFFFLVISILSGKEKPVEPLLIGPALAIQYLLFLLYGVIIETSTKEYIDLADISK